MRISAGLKERFNRAGFFTATQIASATDLGVNVVVERSRDPKVRRQSMGKMTFIDARSFAETLESALLKAAVLALLHRAGVGKAVG